LLVAGEAVRTLPTTAQDPQIGLPAARGVAGPRIRRALALVLVVGALVLGLGSTVAGAQTSSPPNPAGSAGSGVSVVSVVSVNGYIDPIVSSFMSQSIRDANEAHAVALVFQVDLQGSVIPDAELAALIVQMRGSEVPIDLWVGPTGSELAGKASYLLLGVRVFAMAPGTSFESLTTPTALSVELPGEPALSADAATRARLATVGTPGATHRFDAQEARDAKITDRDAPTIGDLFVSLPGVQTKETTVNGVTRLQPVTQVVFTQLPLLHGFFHTAASPAVAYLMFTVGLALLIFELFTAGVGVAGIIGAGALLLGCYGLAVLPTHWWGIALIVAAMGAFAIDVQTGVPRFWTATGMVLYVLGSFTLYDGVSMSWLTIAVGVVGVALAFLAGMPSMVRTRFSTPTIGREWMIGEMGRAVSDIDPDGVVQIRGAQWRAYTNRATPIEQLDAVRVIGIEGLVLEVEPEEGAAKDYRDRGAKPGHEATTNPT
jgi:membrane-bound serine protease (ClpP class)